MDQQHRAVDLPGVGKEPRVHQGSPGGGAPAVIGVERPGVIAPRGLVVVVIVLYEEGRVLRQRVHDAARSGVGSVSEILRALCVHHLPHGLAALLFIFGIEVAVAGDAGHVVHGGGHRRLDPRVDAGCLQGHAAPAADADDADAIGIGIVLNGKKIDGRLKILHVDIGRVHRPGEAAGFAGEGGIEGDGEEAALRHRLCVETGGLLLAGAEGAGDSQRRELALCMLRDIHIRRKGDAEVVDESHLFVIDFIAFRKHLVPFLRELQLLCLHHRISSFPKCCF